MNKISIPVFAINLKSRTGRKQHILQQFCQKEEFDLHIVEACQHPNGAIGLWKSITHILQDLVTDESEYIIICEDDHEFTNDYDKKYLLKCINYANENDADVLLGGVSWFTAMIALSENLFWVEKFTGTQFTIIFRKFFKSILAADFRNNDSADFKMCSLTENKFFMYPFISIQKDFGYSDATSKNNVAGRVSELFENSVKAIPILNEVKKYYQNTNKYIQPVRQSYDNIIIPTYLINLPEENRRHIHINTQFTGRREFDITFVEAVEHTIGEVALWLSIRKVIETAIENDYDVIIICQHDHEFTEHYSRNFLIQNIIESNEQRADYLSGGVGDFRVAIPVSKHKYWVNPCLTSQFIIVYKRFFRRILDEPFDHNVVADRLLSEMTSNKMVLFPFISTQKHFDYSDVPDSHNNVKRLVKSLFSESSRRLETIQKAYLKYQFHNDSI
ncbi:MAG: hypothetical protein ACTHM7_20425 [Ginsengibacter sp.]